MNDIELPNGDKLTVEYLYSSLPDTCPFKTKRKPPKGCRFGAKLFFRLIDEGVLPNPAMVCPFRQYHCKEIDHSQLREIWTDNVEEEHVEECVHKNEQTQNSLSLLRR